MYPIIYSFGVLKIGSFGVMMSIAFLFSYYALKLQFFRLGYKEELAGDFIFFSAFFGILGSKIMHIIEEWNSFVQNPYAHLFSGLTWYGGFILAGGYLLYLIHKHKLSILNTTDAIATVLPLGYGIGRMGCHISGDGDFGILTSNTFLGMPFPSAIVPVDAFYDGINPLLIKYLIVYPTTLWESLYNFLLFIFLWKLNEKNNKTPGMILSLYGILSGFGRLWIEFFRRNPKVLLGLSEAQCISIIMIIAGFIGVFLLRRKNTKH